MARRWFVKHLYTHGDDGGRPYDDSTYPHITAPGGPCDAWDDDQVRTIWLQWASRLGKTFFGQCAVLFAADARPAPLMFASADEKTACDVVERTYGMMANSKRMRKHLRPAHRRHKKRVDFLRCRMHLAWARSSATLADKEVRWGHANEVDKWEHEKTSKEADPLKLFLERGKQFPRRKFLCESTPAIKGKSRVEAGRLKSTNCQYFVPCPHCEKYQVLKLENLKWDKPENNEADPDLARTSARYICPHCEEHILDHHRAWMMRRGVWCPEGCTVKDDAAKAMFEPGGSRPPPGWSLATWLEGTPARDGTDAGYQLSSLYALSLTWGDIAREYVSCIGKPQDLRNFINSWLGETWEEKKRKATWEQIGIRIIDAAVSRGLVPLWGSLVVIGIDCQEDGRRPYDVQAWGPDRRHATIDYGEALTLDALAEVLAREWPHADGGAPIHCSMSLIDQGYRPKGVHEFVLDMLRSGIRILPAKGANAPLDVEWKLCTLGEKTSSPGMQYVLVDTIRTQLWVDEVLHDVKRGEPGSMSLFQGTLGQHQAYLEQLLNDGPDIGLDRNNNSRESWKRIDENKPNDFRDGKRYGYTAMRLTTAGGPIPKRGEAPAVSRPQSPSAAASPARHQEEDRGGGRFKRMKFRRD